MTDVAAPAPPRRRRKKRLGRLGWNLLALAIFVVMIFPVYWMLSTAFKGSAVFDPYAPEALRHQQIADLRERFERKAG